MRIYKTKTKPKPPEDVVVIKMSTDEALNISGLFYKFFDKHYCLEVTKLFKKLHEAAHVPQSKPEL
jgi:hypothetical protein